MAIINKKNNILENSLVLYLLLIRHSMPLLVVPNIYILLVVHTAESLLRHKFPFVFKIKKKIFKA
jgi:hypothetical protein